MLETCSDSCADKIRNQYLYTTQPKELKRNYQAAKFNCNVKLMNMLKHFSNALRSYAYTKQTFASQAQRAVSSRPPNMRSEETPAS